MSTRPARLFVLISGNGSNLQAILDACASGALNAKVVGVISNRAGAYGLERARQFGVKPDVFAKPSDMNRRDYDALLAERILASQPDLVVLAGWMRLLSNAFLASFPGRVVNIHPALPGEFPGVHAIERAFAAYRDGQIASTGVMVHLVPDEGVDDGPVLGVTEIVIEAEDTLETLEERVHAVEHTLYVETLKRLLDQLDLN